MIKAKFGEQIRNKDKVAQANEALCKILYHNVYVVIQSVYELGIEPTFWRERNSFSPSRLSLNGPILACQSHGK